MDNFLTGGITTLIAITLFVAIPSECNFPQSSKIEGQEANLIFPYPCDSTEVTLQQSNRWPFYSSTDGSSLSLPGRQVQRFKVKNLINNGSCSLDLSIRNLMRNDQGKYILFVYKDGDILADDTHRVWLEVDYPPGKASCVVGDDRGGDWVAVDCTANAGSLPGKIECYQNGLWMPSLTEPAVSGSLLKQTILIRKSQPAFCCSSTLYEDKPRCECNDTSLNLGDDGSNHPCPLPSETPTMYHPSSVMTVIENNSSDRYPDISTPPNKMIECNCKFCKKKVITLSFFLCIITILSLVSILFCHYRIKMMNKNDKNSGQVLKKTMVSLLNDPSLENGKKQNGTIKQNGSIKESA